MRFSIVFSFAVILVLSTLVVTDPVEAGSTYESPDGLYGYAIHGSGSETSPYWGEILSFSYSGDTVFLQSALEGYEITTITSLSGCVAETVVVPRTVQHFAEDALDGSTIGTLVFLGDRPDTMPVYDADILVLEGTDGWEDSRETLPLSEYRDDKTSFLYFVLNGNAYVYGSSDSTEIIIPDSDSLGFPFVGVDSEAFRGKVVTSVVLGANMVSIGTRAFYNCETLESVSFAGSVRDIRDEAFRYCIRLGNVDLAGVETIGFESFRDCRSFTSIILPDSVEIMGAGAFYICRSVTALDLGSGIDLIPERAFGYCSSLESVDLTGKTEIGTSAFIRCTSLVSVIMDPGTLSIGNYAFSGCTYLAEIELGNALRSIGSEAFSECRVLQSLTFSDSLESMGEKVFFHCNGLTDLFFKGDMPDTSGDILFGTSDVSIHVYDRYAESWSQYADSLVVEAYPIEESSESDDTVIIGTAIILLLLLIACLLTAVFIRRPRE